MKIEWLDGQLAFRQGPRQLSSHKSAKFQTLGYLLEIPCDLSCAALSFNHNIPITLVMVKGRFFQKVMAKCHSCEPKIGSYTFISCTYH